MRLEIIKIKKEQIGDTESDSPLFSFVHITKGTEDALLFVCQYDLVATFTF